MSIAIVIIDSNDPPVVTLSSLLIDENAPVGSVVGVITIDDEDNYRNESWLIGRKQQHHQFGLAEGTPFELIGPNIRVIGPLDHESIDRYDFEVSVSDSGDPSL